MPPNTVPVDRRGVWGNPFIVGVHGTRAECVDLYAKLAAGYICLSTGNVDAQRSTYAWMQRASEDGMLRGANLACWCPLDSPCHADVLLEIANRAAP